MNSRENNQTDLFAILQDDISLFLLKNYLSTLIDIIHLSLTTQNAHHFFHQHHNKLVGKYLIQHAALGEWESAKKIWQRYPDSLMWRDSVYHPQRYHYQNRSALQIAWMNEEYGVVSEMAVQLNFEERVKQFYEVFPEGKLIKYDWNRQVAEVLLRKLFFTINQDQMITEDNLDKMEDETRIALQLLYDYVLPKKDKICQKGLVFDVIFYQQALKLYDINIGALRRLGQRKFWSVRVEEVIASCLSTGYLRAHCRGIYLIENEKSLNSRECRLADGTSYFSHQRNPKTIAGSDFYIDAWGRQRTMEDWCERECTRPYFERLMLDKDKNKAQLVKRYLQPKVKGCVLF